MRVIGDVEEIVTIGGFTHSFGGGEHLFACNEAIRQAISSIQAIFNPWRSWMVLT